MSQIYVNPSRLVGRAYAYMARVRIVVGECRSHHHAPPTPHPKRLSFLVNSCAGRCDPPPRSPYMRCLLVPTKAVIKNQRIEPPHELLFTHTREHGRSACVRRNGLFVGAKLSSLGANAPRKTSATTIILPASREHGSHESHSTPASRVPRHPD